MYLIGPIKLIIYYYNYCNEGDPSANSDHFIPLFASTASRSPARAPFSSFWSSHYTNTTTATTTTATSTTAATTIASTITTATTITSTITATTSTATTTIVTTSTTTATTAAAAAIISSCTPGLEEHPDNIYVICYIYIFSISLSLQRSFMLLYLGMTFRLGNVPDVAVNCPFLQDLSPG